MFPTPPGRKLNRVGGNFTQFRPNSPRHDPERSDAALDELVAECRARLRALPIVVLSSAPEARTLAASIGAVAYLPKPLTVPHSNVSAPGRPS